jgi:CHASE2 domain-containing sensor protein
MSSTPSTKITLVVINDEDYASESMFQGASPLRQDRVVKLINAIQSFKPSIIGVDLDTGHWKPDMLPETAPARIVWARLFKPDPEAPLAIQSREDLQPLPGRQPPQHCSGLTGMQPDPDFVIRQYPEFYTVTGKGADGGAHGKESLEPAYLSFGRVVHLMHLGAPCQETTLAIEERRTEENWEERRVLIQFRGEGHDLHQISAGAVLEAAAIQDNRTREALTGRIVLLGGTYSAGRDRYPTPVGMMAGVEILGHTIETELGAHIADLSGILSWIDVGLGASIVLIGAFRRKLALAVDLLAMVVLLLLSNWLFRTMAVFFNAIPVLAGALLHNMLDPIVEPWLHPLARWFQRDDPAQSTPPQPKH